MLVMVDVGTGVGKDRVVVVNVGDVLIVGVTPDVVVVLLVVVVVVELEELGVVGVVVVVVDQGRLNP